MKSTFLKAVSVSVVLTLSGVLSTATLDKVQFLKIAPQDARAVIKGADGKLQVIKPGDRIGETVMVKEISAGRIVLEEKTARGPETVIVRIEKNGQRIERLSKQPGEKPVLVAPAQTGR